MLITSLELVLTLEEPDSGTAAAQPDRPVGVAAGWMERLESQLAAWAKRDAVVGGVVVAATRAEAIRRLGAAPLGFSETAARHILEMPLGWLPEEGQEELRAHLGAALSHVEDL